MHTPSISRQLPILLQVTSAYTLATARQQSARSSELLLHTDRVNDLKRGECAQIEATRWFKKRV